ncbi:MAG TPA: UPF0182 family protein [Clostridia bacterium]
MSENNIYDFDKENMKKRLKKNVIALSLIFVFVVSAIASILIYLDIIQLNEIGNYGKIYTTNLFYQGIFGVVSFILMFVMLFITNIFIIKNIKDYFNKNSLPKVKLPNFSISILISLAGAFLTRDVFYQSAINFINWHSFNKVDPIFHKDIGYYVFQRPFLMTMYDFVVGLWVFMIIYTAAYYIFVLFVNLKGLTPEDLKINSVIRHNLINIAIFFLIKAAGYKFQAEGILYSSFKDLNGAGYVDANFWLNYYKIAPFLIIAIAIASFFFIIKHKLRFAAYAIAAFPAIWIIVTLVSGVFQQVVVKPNEINLERPYLRNNMINTREAYGLNKVKSLEFPAMQALNPDIIRRNSDTKDNIRVIDYGATLESNKQLQSNAGFYTFYNGNIVNYTINGKEIPVLITPREIDKHNLPDKSYVNTTFKYTHGYGVVVNPINKLTPQGQVEYILNGLKLESSDPTLKINKPEIYYGQTTNDYVIVNANNLKEIDYDGRRESTYAGNGGVKLGFLSKLLFSLKYADYNMFFSGYVNENSKLLLNRNIIERSQMPVPFLKIDNDPYIIITSEGRLLWVADGYTTTDFYPYSQSSGESGEFNYIRNSVKVVTDAYDGTVKYYVIDRDDPLIKTYMKAYPGVFIDEPLPKDVSMHSRYPENLFKIQTEILRRYHLDPLDPNRGNQNVDEFYSKNDYWDIAKYSSQVEGGTSASGVSGQKIDIEPYYNMINLPLNTGNKEELILMRPFTQTNKDNMASWLAVRNSGPNYGELILFNFPKNTNIFGPYQVDVKISQLDNVSKDISLWNQSGSSVFKGNLLVIPIENSILYVEPIYIKATGGSSIPEVRKIVVGYQDGEEFKSGSGADLDSALNDLFKIQVATPSPAVTLPGTTGTGDKKDQSIKDIRAKYNDLKKQLDELGDLINNLQ